MDEVAEHNHAAWNREASESCRWSIPASAEEIEAGRAGRPRIILTPDTTVPEGWLGKLQDRKVLCLGSGGGQQAPLLAAAGARGTSFDLSDEQLALDRQVAEREGLTVRTVQGYMRDLSVFPDETFDRIVHVTADVFVPDVNPVWRECHRVLRPGGELLSGLKNPGYFLFDHDALEGGEAPLVVHSLPFSDKTSRSAEDHQKRLASHDLLEFGHTLDDLIGEQIRAGLVIVDFLNMAGRMALRSINGSRQ
jgi:SAM-dependent methyltransferase